MILRYNRAPRKLATILSITSYAVSHNRYHPSLVMLNLNCKYGKSLSVIAIIAAGTRAQLAAVLNILLYYLVSSGTIFGHMP